ncbi:MAG: DUF5320 domain-containing protein [Actinomycetota bacterium]|nr:DUF5320 domain-containing protein [Actinomycetota bacterium]
MPRGYRWMYYATGLPGWMRFGFSPGWLGISPYGLGPCATYLMTGRWPLPWPSYAPTMPFGPTAFAPPYMTPEEELEMLKDQAQFLKQQLEQIGERIKDLEKKAKEK